MRERIALLPGDGVGPEVTAEAVRLLEEVAPAVGLDLEFEEAPIGGQAIDLTGSPLPEATFSLAREARAVLLGAVGGPRWDELDMERRPEAALLGLRKGLEMYANLRPVRSYKAIQDASPIKHTFLEGIDLLIVRELTGGVYFGEPRGLVHESGLRTGFNTMVYNEQEVQRIARVAFDAAMRRRRSLTSVDKANVLETSRLWRQVVTEVGLDYPEVQLRHQYVDNCAMQIIIKPAQFDVILTSNLFGDILSDEASVLGGSIGLLPSASLGPASALYEPIHGSAPDIAGRDVANPIAAMLSAAMMLRHSLGSDKGAEAVERAVENVLDRGYRTADLAAGGRGAVGTREMGRLVREETIRLLEGDRAAG